MTYKLTCPSCGTYTSAAFRAYEDGRPCPRCGASLSGASKQYYAQLPDDHSKLSNADICEIQEQP